MQRRIGKNRVDNPNICCPLQLQLSTHQAKQSKDKKDMSHHLPHPQQDTTIIFFLLLFSLLPALNSLPVLPSNHSFHSNPSQPLTIPSFPEQSALLSCPLHLPDQLFPAVNASCSPRNGQLSKTKCCPVLAAWLYSAYSNTALGLTASSSSRSSDSRTTSLSFEMPLLPDDSETCVDGLESRMRVKGLNLVRPNQTCDVVYCFCGIRFHPLSCPQAFRVSDTGDIVGDPRVSLLERHCLNARHNGTRHRLARCSKCLHSLYSLKTRRTGSRNETGLERQTQKIRNRDCEMMGLTWLLNKDRDAYMSTVTAVMRALMQNSDDSEPLSCSLSSDGMPLAVDSAEINDQSSSLALPFSSYLYSSLLILLIMYLLH